MNGQMKVHAVTLAAIAVLAMLAAPIGAGFGPGGAGTAAGNVGNSAAHVPLEDGAHYWQGQVVYSNSHAVANEEIEVVADSGTHVESTTADEDGYFEFDTSEFPTGEEFMVYNESGEVATIEVHEQVLELNYTTLLVSDGGTIQYAVVDYSSNRGVFDATIDSSLDDLDERSEQIRREDGEFVQEVRGDLYINVSDLDGGTHTIEMDVQDTTAEASVTVDLDDPPEVEERPPLKHDYDPSEHELVDGETYWQGVSLVGEGEESGSTIHVRNEEDRLVLEVPVNDSGGYRISTVELELGEFQVKNESGAVLATIQIEEQSVGMEFDDPVTHGEQTTLEVDSPRDGYDLYLWSLTIDRDELADLIPAAEVQDNKVVLKNVSEHETVEVDTAVLEPGEFTVAATVADTGQHEWDTIEIEPKPTPTPTETATLTPTPSPTPTPSATPTATATSTDGATVAGGETPTSTETPTSSPTQTPSEAPGFGPLLALLAIAAAICWRSR